MIQRKYNLNEIYVKCVGEPPMESVTEMKETLKDLPGIYSKNIYFLPLCG